MGNGSRRCIVILNRDSGKAETKPSADELEAAFRRHGLDVSIQQVSSGDDIGCKVTELVGRESPECVVAAGGDGTICAVTRALSGGNVELGVLPLGTFNYFARRVGVPEDLDAAVEVICQAKSRPLNLGSLNGRIFLNNASIGLYAAILKERESIYRRWGRSRLAAYWSVLVAMTTVYPTIPMRISIDGEALSTRSPMVFVGISAYQLDSFGIEGADAIRQGKLAVLVPADCGRLQLIWTALLIALRGIRKGRDFTLLTGKNVSVETRKATRLVALDGERERMHSPFEFRIHENAIRVRLPEQAHEGLASA